MSVALEPIVGRYFTLQHNGAAHRVYFEEAGSGPPLLCLHTAGADGRQFRDLLNDAEVTRVLDVFRAASTAPAWMAPDKTMRPAGTVADGWRVVCIALSSSPEFYVY